MRNNGVPDGPVAIVGVGLMGGSLGRALVASGFPEVTGYDPDPQVARDATGLGALTRPCGSIAEAVDGAAAAFVAAPIGILSPVVGEVLGAAPDGCVVSDLGSAKAAIVNDVAAHSQGRFVGGHPICGGERSGLDAGRADMFDGATWFLTPTPDVRPELYQRVHGIIARLGARPVAIDAVVHDRLMALVSHVPHVLASALIDQGVATAPEGRQALRSAGPSFHDLTRVAASNPELWADILRANRDAVLAALGDFRGRLEAVEQSLEADDRAALVDFIARGAQGRDDLRRHAVPTVAADRHEVRVGVPNRPGVLSQIVTVLGHAHINIEDLALHPASVDGGELVMVVEDADQARDAVARIIGLGYPAQARRAHGH